MPQKTINAQNEKTKRKELCQELFELCTQPNDQFKFETTFLKINETLEKIIDLEKNIELCCSETRKEIDFLKFIQFLFENNCILNDNISIQKLDKSSSEYGLIAKKPFKKGDLVFDVPKCLILTIQEAEGSNLENLIKNDKMLSLMPNLSLALFILYLKLSKTKDNKFSKWSPYLKVLPNEFHTPLYFNLDEIKMLQYSQSFYEVLFHIKNIARQYAYLYLLLDSKKELEEFKSKFSWQNFKWAVSIVSTRQNQIVDENKKPLLAMIPLLDMCNHEFGEFCTDYNDETKTVLCYANKDLNIDDNITIFYGKRTNQEMLIHNGFVCETNIYNSIKLKLIISTKDELNDKRLNLLEKYGLNRSENFDISIGERNEILVPLKIYFFVQIILMKIDEDLTEFDNIELAKLEDYIKEKKLEKNEQIRQYLKIKLLVITKSLEQHKQKFDLNSTSAIFIQRLIDSEISLLKLFLNHLNNNDK